MTAPSTELPPIEPLRVYTFKQLQALLGINHNAALAWLRLHELDEVRVGNRHRILGSQIIEALSEIVEW